jgi:hypothetical protein
VVTAVRSIIVSILQYFDLASTNLILLVYLILLVVQSNAVIGKGPCVSDEMTSRRE